MTAVRDLVYGSFLKTGFLVCNILQCEPHPLNRPSTTEAITAFRESILSNDRRADPANWICVSIEGVTKSSQLHIIDHTDPNGEVYGQIDIEKHLAEGHKVVLLSGSNRQQAVKELVEEEARGINHGLVEISKYPCHVASAGQYNILIIYFFFYLVVASDSKRRQHCSNGNQPEECPCCEHPDGRW